MFKSFCVIAVALAISTLMGCGSKSKCQDCVGGINPSAPSSLSSVASSTPSSSSMSSVTSMSSTASNSSATAQANCLESALVSGYCLVWQDEFATNTLNTQVWSYEKNCYGGGNNEAQCYTDNPNNSWVDGDLLHIKAVRENAVGPARLDDDPSYNASDVSGNGTYTSARLRTKKKADWTYGRFEIRAKLPAGQGTWPAIWMLPSDDVYGGWANSGEIDIMEAVNLKAGGERQVHGTLHYGSTWPNNTYSGSHYSLAGNANPADDFHIYAVEWEQGEIRWYVDGDHYATQTSAGWYTVSALDNSFAPFDQRFHMILNFAVGGNWPEGANNKGIDATAFPQEMLVDYVRVYQCTVDPKTGKGCATRDNNFEANPGNTPPAPSENAESMIFNGATGAAYQWGTYASAGTVAYQLKNVGGIYGNVAEVTYNTADGIGFFQSMVAQDLSRFKNIRFDVRVISAPSNALALQFRADCKWPCTSGNYPLPAMALNTWTPIQIPLAELATAGLNLSAVDTPFVLAPVTGTAAGVVLQLDNIELLQ